MPCLGCLLGTLLVCGLGEAAGDNAGACACSCVLAESELTACVASYSCCDCIYTYAEQLPPHSLEQALLLLPELLNHLLESAAAAVLRPILQHTGENPAGTRPDSGQHTGVGSSSSSVQSMQSLLSAGCPWMQSLPAMLAHNPLLLLKVCPHNAAHTVSAWGFWLPPATLCPDCDANSKQVQPSCRRWRHCTAQCPVASTDADSLWFIVLCMLWCCGRRRLPLC
jgi:hypothetical protein